MEPILEKARPFWGDALDLKPIRFVDSPSARLTGRAFVTHNTIHWPGPLPVLPSNAEMAVVIHELAHCWQYQSGRWQITRGLIEQILYTLFGLWLKAAGGAPLYDPYDYGGPEGLSTVAGLRSLRLEAQAAVIEHYWRMSSGLCDAIQGAALRGPDGSPTLYARDLRRICREAGLP